MEVIAAKVAERETKTPREVALRDFVRYSWRATRGLENAVDAEASELIRRMVEVGRLTSDEGERVYRTLRARIEASRAIFERRVEESARRAMERAGDLSTRELAKLASQAEMLERRVERLKRN